METLFSDCLIISEIIGQLVKMPKFMKHFAN